MSEVPQIYDALIEPIRYEDRNTRFLYAYLVGPQTLFEILHEKIKDIPLLNDPRDCPDEFLIYLKDIVGFDSALDFITSGLDSDDLRRLIQSAAILWKERGTQPGLEDFFRAFTGKPSVIFNWFDMIYLLDEDEFTYDEPWLLGDPGDSTFSEFQSYLYVMDEGDLDRSLAQNVINLARPFSERVRIVYFDFLDDFRFGLGNWIDTGATPPVIVDKELKLASSGIVKTYADTLKSADWTNYTFETVFRFEILSGTPSVRFGFYRTSNTNKYEVYYSENIPAGGPGLVLYRNYPGNDGIVVQALTPLLPYDTKFGMKINAVDLVGGDVKIQAFIDDVKYIDTIDSGSIPDKGSIELQAEDGVEVFCDIVSLYERPIEYDDVNP